MKKIICATIALISITFLSQSFAANETEVLKNKTLNASQIANIEANKFKFKDLYYNIVCIVDKTKKSQGLDLAVRKNGVYFSQLFINGEYKNQAGKLSQGTNIVKITGVSSYKDEPKGTLQIINVNKETPFTIEQCSISLAEGQAK